MRMRLQKDCSSYEDELSRFGWRQRKLSSRKYSHDSGYDSDDSNCSFVSAHSTKSEPALDQAGSPKSMRSRRSLKWLGTTMKETAVKSVNYLPGAQCLPLPSRHAEQDLSQEKHETVAPCNFRGLHRRVASAPGEFKAKEEDEGQSPVSITKTFGSNPPFVRVVVTNKPSDKDVKVVRFVALPVKNLPDDFARDLINFLTDLLDPSEWPFEFVYDLRELPIPKLHMIVTLAKWGSEAKRRDYFIKRCVGCRIILSPGMMFNFTKASCVAFFKVCPPTCNTYLMTEDSEPGPDTHFFPPPKAVVEMREREAEAKRQGKLKSPQTQSLEQNVPAEAMSSGANPQDSEVQENLVVNPPASYLSWFAYPVQKICTQRVAPPECFSFLAAPKRSGKSSNKGADQLDQLSQTVAAQQKTIEVLNKRILALERGDVY